MPEESDNWQATLVELCQCSDDPEFSARLTESLRGVAPDAGLTRSARGCATAACVAVGGLAGYVSLRMAGGLSWHAHGLLYPWLVGGAVGLAVAAILAPPLWLWLRPRTGESLADYAVRTNRAFGLTVRGPSQSVVSLAGLVGAFSHPQAPSWLRDLVPPEPPATVPTASALAAQLRSPDVVKRWQARLLLLWAGGESIASIDAERRGGRIGHMHALGLLKAIAAESARQHDDRSPTALCGHCGARFRAHKKPYLDLEAKYYTCRACGRSRNPLWDVRQVVCLLDARSDRPNRVLRKGGTVWINWLARARAKRFEGLELFDFDRVEIVAASDDEVRHFLVDVTSDTDRKRRNGYAAMACRVAPDCALSENTLAALRETFGSVEVSR